MMNKNQIHIPESHRSHFNIVRKIQGLRTQNTEFVLHKVYPVDIIGYLVSDKVSIRVWLNTEIDRELFEAWLDEQDAPEDLIVEYEIGRTMHDRMLWDTSDPIEYHCYNCGVPVHASGFEFRAAQRAESCAACWERGE